MFFDNLHTVRDCSHSNLRTVCDYLRCNRRTSAYAGFLWATRVSYVGCLYQYSRTPKFDLKKYKMLLMEISWALTINYPNCFNHPNLRNHSISQSINRGLEEGINQSILEIKVMLVVYLQKYWSSRTQSHLVAKLSLSQKLGCTLISYNWLLIKRILLPTLCWVSFMYYG